MSTVGVTLTRTGPALLVALGAAATTAHGGFEVAVAAGVPSGIAWLYPGIGDGLALVAYSATNRLGTVGRRYSWTVVVLAAGVSGLAQAVLLASGTLHEAPPGLRFGVGAWPALAAAIAAHLLHLLRTSTGDAVHAARPEQPAPPAEVSASSSLAASERGDVGVADAPREGSTLSCTPAPSQVSDLHRSGGCAGPDDADPRTRQIAELLAAGCEVTGPQVAALNGVSDRTGRRLLADARIHLEHSHRPDLHLVENRSLGGSA